MAVLLASRALGADAGSDQIESVTVSARRVTENAQAVPIPIAVVSGIALENARQFRLEDLNQRLPSTNVQFGNPRQTSIAVRGLGNNPANDALESSVGDTSDEFCQVEPWIEATGPEENGDRSPRQNLCCRETHDEIIAFAHRKHRRD